MGFRLRRGEEWGTQFFRSSPYPISTPHLPLSNTNFVLILSNFVTLLPLFLYYPFIEKNERGIYANWCS